MSTLQSAKSPKRVLQNQDKCATLPVANTPRQFTEDDMETIRQIKRLVIPFLNRLQELEGHPPVIVPGSKRTKV